MREVKNKLKGIVGNIDVEIKENKREEIIEISYRKSSPDIHVSEKGRYASART